LPADSPPCYRRCRLQELWFKLLDAVVIPLRRLKSQRNRMKVTKPNFATSAGGPGQKMDGTFVGAIYAARSCPSM
jgi:hypothetical protein